MAEMGLQDGTQFWDPMQTLSLWQCHNGMEWNGMHDMH